MYTCGCMCTDMCVHVWAHICHTCACMGDACIFTSTVYTNMLQVLDIFSADFPRSSWDQPTRLVSVREGEERGHAISCTSIQ